jgi:hypothetical protein
MSVSANRCSFHVSLLIHRVRCHIHVPLVNNIFDVTKADSLLFGAFLDDLHDGEPINGQRLLPPGRRKQQESCHKDP